jgi:hypothetical protein
MTVVQYAELAQSYSAHARASGRSSAKAAQPARLRGARRHRSARQSSATRSVSQAEFSAENRSRVTPRRTGGRGDARSRATIGLGFQGVGTRSPEARFPSPSRLRVFLSAPPRFAASSQRRAAKPADRRPRPSAGSRASPRARRAETARAPRSSPVRGRDEIRRAGVEDEDSARGAVDLVRVAAHLELRREDERVSADADRDATIDDHRLQRPRARQRAGAGRRPCARAARRARRRRSSGRVVPRCASHAWRSTRPSRPSATKRGARAQPRRRELGQREDVSAERGVESQRERAVLVPAEPRAAQLRRHCGREAEHDPRRAIRRTCGAARPRRRASRARSGTACDETRKRELLGRRLEAEAELVAALGPARRRTSIRGGGIGQGAARPRRRQVRGLHGTRALRLRDAGDQDEEAKTRAMSMVERPARILVSKALASSEYSDSSSGLRPYALLRPGADPRRGDASCGPGAWPRRRPRRRTLSSASIESLARRRVAAHARG